MTAKKKMKELREKLDSELEFDIRQLDEELFNLRFKSSSEGISNPSRIGLIRREIACMRTLLTERELGVRGAEPRT